MKGWDERVFAYGMPMDAGPIECVDCGHRLEHERRDPLPPCPRYRDSTHARAGWRALEREPPREEDR